MIRKLITLMLLSSVAFLVSGQDIPPTDSNFKKLQSPSFNYYTITHRPWMYMGSMYGWRELASWSQMIDTLNYYKLKSDSLAPYGYTRRDRLASELAKKENLLPETPTNPDQKFLNANKLWAVIPSVGAGGYAGNLYYTTINSDISGYKKIQYTPESTETELTATLTNQEILVRTYVYDNPISVSVIDAGLWVSNTRVKVSGTQGISQTKIEIFLRHINGTETTLFSAYSDEIDNTSYLNIRKESSQQSFNCDPTDRLGARIYFKTTASNAITFYTIIGDGNGAYFTTPLPIRHTQLRDLNDDANYLHVTPQAQTFGGVKTFTSSPVVPTPTTDYQASTKKYVDDGLNGKVTSNSAIAGATKTKITYDSNGLVTFGADATANDIGLGNVTNDAQVKRSEMGAANGVATLLANGKLPSSQVPSIAISETFPITNESDKVLLSSAEKGDIAIVSTTSKSYILKDDPYSVESNWVYLRTPESPIQSVNGLVGSIQINPSLSGNTLSLTGGTATVNIGSATDVAANTSARHSAVTLGTVNGLSLSGQQLSLGLSSTSTTGALSSTDWNTFNSKQTAYTNLTSIGSLTNGSGFLKNNGSGTFSYTFPTFSEITSKPTTLAGYGIADAVQLSPASAQNGNIWINGSGYFNTSLRVNGLSGTGTRIITASPTGQLGVVSGSGFVKADGSVDSNSYLTGITSSQVTTALGYTPYNSTNPAGYISSYTETDPIFSVHTVKNISNGTGLLRNNGSGTWSYDNASYITSTALSGYATQSWVQSNFDNYGYFRLLANGVLAGDVGSTNTLNIKSGSGIQVSTDASNSVTISATGGSGTVTSITAGTGLSGGTITTSGTLAVDFGITHSTAAYGDHNHTGVYQPVGNYLTGITSSMVTTALGYTPYNSSNPSGFITSSSLSGYATESWVTNRGYLTSYTETDPTIYSWAKASTKPTYTYSEVDAAPSSTVSFPGFGTTHTTAAYGDHNHSGVYQPVGNYLTGITSSQVTTALGYTPYSSTNPSGFITGNQTITLSGIVTGSGTTSIATSIADGALSIAKTSGLQSALDAKLSLSGGTLTGALYGTSVTLTGNLTCAEGYRGNSDIRLKENIKPIELDASKIELKQFEFKADSTNRIHYGVIAQEVEKIAPELVYTDEKGIKSVAYIDLIIAKIAALEKENAELLKRIEKLEKAK